MSSTPRALAPPNTLEIQRRARDYSLEPTRNGAPWREIPEDALPFSKRGTLSVAGLALNTPTVVVQYAVPRGFKAVLTKIFNKFIPAASLTEGVTSLAFWTIDIATPAGGPTPAARFLTDYGQIFTQLGDFQGPWPLDCGERFSDGDLISYKFSVSDASLTQPGMLTHCMLIGWNWPAERLNRA